MSHSNPDKTATDGAAPLMWARGLRDFGDGFVAVLLPVYLTALGFSPLEVGVIATAALLGSALLTLGIGLIGGRHDQRRLLLAAASLMVATGVAFSLVHDFAVLLVVAFAGTVNPSAGSVSVFVPLEHAVLSRAVADRARTQLFARYSLIGALSSAVGALAAAAPDYVSAIGVGQLAAIKGMFVLYALLGVLGALAYARIPPLRPAPEQRTTAALGPSRGIVYKLAALFSLDAFAGGFVVQSLLALWLFERFDMSLSVAAHRSRQHHGLHPHSVQRLPDPGGGCSHALARAPAAADPRRAVADGRADTLILRHGSGYRARAAGRGELHLGAAQPCGFRQPGACRRDDGGILAGVAAGHLRRAEDPL
jgi:MFS family permease